MSLEKYYAMKVWYDNSANSKIHQVKPVKNEIRETIIEYIKRIHLHKEQ